MARIKWSDPALFDVERIVGYIEQSDLNAAERFGCALFEAGNSLSIFPHRGRPVPGGFRELVSVRPFVIRYRVENGAVTIVEVRHMARDR